jgi:D-alanyl-D-alanine dipeptidase
VFVCAVAGAAAVLQLTASTAAAAADGPSTAAAAAGADTAAAAEGPAELWVDLYTPHSISDLVVHKKKVQEVQDWLTFYQEHKSRHHTRAVLVTGRIV